MTFNFKSWAKAKKTIAHTLTPTGINKFEPENLHYFLSETTFECNECYGAKIFTGENAIAQMIKRYPETTIGHPLLVYTNLYNQMNNNYVEASSDSMNAQEISEIIEVCVGVFDKLPKVFERINTEIIVLPVEGYDSDSQTEIYKNKGNFYALMKIFQTRIESKMYGDSSESIIIHELGHVIHAAITGSFQKPPFNFDDYVKNVVMYDKPLTAEEAAEFFADTFLIAILYKTELYDSNLNNLSGHQKRDAYNYIKNLLKICF